MNMKYTRRIWTRRFAGAIAACFLCRNVSGQTTTKRKCDGFVTDAGKNGIKDIEVAIIDHDGTGETAKTDSTGYYCFEAPEAMPYAIIFRDQKGFSTLLDVRGLTPGRNQMLSITIEGQSSYQRGYGTLQAVEAVAALAAAGAQNDRMQTFLRRFPDERLQSDIDRVSKLTDLSARERSFLGEKAKSVRTLLSLAKTGGKREVS